MGDAKFNALEGLTKLEYENEIRLMDGNHFYLKYSSKITPLEKYVLFQSSDVINNVNVVNNYNY